MFTKYSENYSNFYRIEKNSGFLVKHKINILRKQLSKCNEILSCNYKTHTL